MKTLNKAILGASVMAATAALGVTTVSALTFGSFFDSFFGANSNSSASTEQRVSANADVTAETQASTESATGTDGFLDATINVSTGAVLQHDTNITGNSSGAVLGTTTVDGDYDMNAKTEVSVFTKFVTWIKSIFGISAESSANGSVYLD